MKIAIILPTLQGGGAEKVYITIGEYLKYKLNYEVDIIIFKDLIDYQTSLKVINILNKDEKISKNAIKFFKKLYNILKNYDIIMGGLELEPNYIAILFSKILKKPCICMHHSLMDKLIDKLYRKKRHIFHALNFLLLKFADMNVAVSKEVYENIIKLYKIPKNKCIYIYNPIDIDKIRELADEEIEDEYKAIFDKRTLCFIARLEEYKGLKKVISTLSELKEYNLLVLGNGDFKSYYEYAKYLGVGNRVFYLGFKNNPYKYLKHCFALVLPSEFEGFGLVFYEANALGVPIVGSGIKEAFGKHNEYGIWAYTKDEIISAIKLLENPDAYNYYREMGLKRVENFRIDKIAREYEKVFKELR